MHPTLASTPSERAERNAIVDRILRATETNTVIKLPPFDPTRATPAVTALLAIGNETNPFGGSVGEFRYQFEGEEDLLHLFVLRLNGDPLTVAEGQSVVDFVLRGVSPALIWLKPGEQSQHFYVGHDEVLATVVREL